MPDPARCVSLQEIAARAGVAKSTVSLALRGNAHVTEGTRARVLRAAAELGYQPDPTIARIAARRWNRRHTRATLCLLHVTPLHRRGLGGIGVERSVPALILEGAERAADQIGYSLDHIEVAPSYDLAALRSALVHRGVEGLILSNMNRRLDGFDFARFAVVQCQQGHLDLRFDKVVSDPHRGMELAWQAVAARGHERVGFATFHQLSSQEEVRREAAFLLLQALHHRRGRPEIPIFRGEVRDGQVVEESARPAFLKWVQRWKPDVVIGLTGLFEWWLRSASYEVPAEIGFAALIATPGTHVSGVDPRYPELGYLAVKALDGNLRLNLTGPAADPHTLLVAPVFREGDTLRPAAAT